MQLECGELLSSEALAIIGLLSLVALVSVALKVLVSDAGRGIVEGSMPM